MSQDEFSKLFKYIGKRFNAAEKQVDMQDKNTEKLTDTIAELSLRNDHACTQS